MNGIDITQFVRAPAATPILELTAVRTILLGAGSNAPIDVSDVEIWRDTMYVVDGAVHQLRAYDPTGRPLWNSDGAAGGQAFAQPRRVIRAGDTLYVTDLAGDVRLFTPAGALVRRLTPPTDNAIWSIAAIGSRLFLSMADPEPDDSSRSMVLVLTHDGTVVGRGCRRDPLVEASIERNGILAGARLANVTTNGRIAFCQQVITPVIQELDSSGRVQGVVNRAPPFYVEPRDQPASTDQRRILAQSATWHPQVLFSPSEHGYLQANTSYDSVTQKRSYALFLCDSSGGAARCASGDLSDRPVRFVGPDTIYAVRDGTAATAPAIVVLHATMRP